MIAIHSTSPKSRSFPSWASREAKPSYWRFDLDQIRQAAQKNLEARAASLKSDSAKAIYLVKNELFKESRRIFYAYSNITVYDFLTELLEFLKQRADAFINKLDDSLKISKAKRKTAVIVVEKLISNIQNQTRSFSDLKIAEILQQFDSNKFDNSFLDSILDTVKARDLFGEFIKAVSGIYEPVPITAPTRQRSKKLPKTEIPEKVKEAKPETIIIDEVKKAKPVKSKVKPAKRLVIKELLRYCTRLLYDKGDVTFKELLKDLKDKGLSSVEAVMRGKNYLLKGNSLTDIHKAIGSIKALIPGIVTALTRMKILDSPKWSVVKVSKNAGLKKQVIASKAWFNEGSKAFFQTLLNIPRL